jgi:hypothetical protein
MRSSSYANAFRTRLALESLEGRSVPAGNIAAAISPTGVLSLVGDDQANTVTILVTGLNVVVTPDASTNVNSAGAGNAVTLTGIAKSLATDLKGGDDSLSIDGASDFVLTGSAAIQLGGGSNTLNLVTTGQLQLGSLAVTADDGIENVTVSAGAGLGKVSGNASFNYVGVGNTNLSEMSFLGTGGVKIANIAGSVSAIDTTISKTFSWAAVGQTSIVGLTRCTIGSVKLTGDNVTTSIQNSTISGNVASNAFQSFFSVVGPFQAKNVSVTGITAYFQATGTTVNIMGNLTVAATVDSLTSFNTSDLSQIQGNLRVTSGKWDDTFKTNFEFHVHGNALIDLGEGNNTIQIGNGPQLVSFDTNLTIKTGAGIDSVSLEHVGVTRTTSIQTGAGGDSLTIDDGSIFNGPLSANLGAGDDNLAVAQNTSSANAVTFDAKVTILMGTGNDTMQLGKGTGGDANSAAAFRFAGSKIDGGTGLNLFDDGTPMQYTGLTFGTSIVNFTDPNP